MPRENDSTWLLGCSCCGIVEGRFRMFPLHHYATLLVCYSLFSPSLSSCAGAEGRVVGVIYLLGNVYKAGRSGGRRRRRRTSAIQLPMKCGGMSTALLTGTPINYAPPGLLLFRFLRMMRSLSRGDGWQAVLARPAIEWRGLRAHCSRQRTPFTRLINCRLLSFPVLLY